MLLRKNIQIYLQFLAKDLRMCFLAFSCIKLLRDVVLERSSQYLVLFKASKKGTEFLGNDHIHSPKVMIAIFQVKTPQFSIAFLSSVLSGRFLHEETFKV